MDAGCGISACPATSPTFFRASPRHAWQKQEQLPACELMVPTGSCLSPGVSSKAASLCVPVSLVHPCCVGRRLSVLAVCMTGLCSGENSRCPLALFHKDSVLSGVPSPPRLTVSPSGSSGPDNGL